MAVAFGDTDYRKPAAQLIRDLIETANPGFKAKAPADSYTLSVPTNFAVVAPSVNDTAITLTAASGQSKIIGKSTFNYRRINLNKLFNGRTLVLEKYLTPNLLPFADVVALISSQLGVNIDAADFVGPTSLSPDNPYTWNIATSSLCYKGSLRVTWTKGKRDVAEMFGDGVLAGRVWPDGLIDVQDGSKPQGELMFYDTDFAAMASTFNSWTFGAYDNGQWNTAVNTAPLMAYLKTIKPEIAWSQGDARVLVGGLGMTFVKRYTLPNSAVPEANSALYNRVMVLEPITPGDVRQWYFGRLLLHYNA